MSPSNILVTPWWTIPELGYLSLDLALWLMVDNGEDIQVMRVYINDLPPALFEGLKARDGNKVTGIDRY